MIRNSDEKLDCSTRVITPENIEFEYSLAGPFQRLPAFLFDFAVRALALGGLVIVLSMLSAFLAFGGSLVMIVVLLSFFLLSWFYGIYFETRFNGRTPGKMLFKLRVISVDGRPINGTQAALRNLLRLADMCILLPLSVLEPEAAVAFVIPTFSIGLVSMTLSPRLQRLGDLAAGTMVISEYGRRSPVNILPEDARAFGLAELIPTSFQPSTSLAQTVGLYMENRRRLSPQRRHEVAKHLAEPLLARFQLLPDTSYDLLLCAVYTRTFLSVEQRRHGQERMRAVRSGPLRPTQLPGPSAVLAAVGVPEVAAPAVVSAEVATPEVIEPIVEPAVEADQSHRGPGNLRN